MTYIYSSGTLSLQIRLTCLHLGFSVGEERLTGRKWLWKDPLQDSYGFPGNNHLWKVGLSGVRKKEGQ